MPAAIYARKATIYLWPREAWEGDPSSSPSRALMRQTEIIATPPALR